MKSKSTIQKQIRKLRIQSESSPCAITKRVSNSMEHALRWVALDTVGWQSMDKEAIEYASIIRDELKDSLK